MNKLFFKSLFLTTIAFLSCGSSSYAMKQPNFTNPNPRYLGNNFNPNYNSNKQSFSSSFGQKQQKPKKQFEETFAVLAFVKDEVIDKSFNKLTKNTGKQKGTGYSVTLEDCFNSYLNFYGPNAKQGKQIFENGDKLIQHKASNPHITLTEAGIIETRNGIKYVKSFDGKTIVTLDLAVKTVLDTIRDCEKEFKLNYRGTHYSSKLTFEFENGSKFMYDKSNQNGSQNKTNVWIARKLKTAGYNGSEKRFYILGKRIQAALKRIGLAGKYNSFEPHMSISNVSSVNTLGKKRNGKTIELIEHLEKDNKTAISQILESVDGNGNNQFFETISINAGFNNTVKTCRFTENKGVLIS